MQPAIEGPTIDWDYRCAMCSSLHAARHADYCTHCGAPVLAEPSTVSGESLMTHRPGIWRYYPHLPISLSQVWMSQGEGTIPIISSPSLAEEVGVRSVWLMLEGLNPSGSFKDRAVVAGLAHAVQFGARGVVCASSGNAAAATAAYAARAGLPAVIVVPEAVPTVKVRLAQTFNPVVLKVSGDYSVAFNLARELCQRLEFANLTTTYVNPTMVAALRTVAFDISRQLNDRIDRVLVPTGAGPLVHGVVSGFNYLRAKGDVDSTPRVDAVQAAGCAPVAYAFEAEEPGVRPWGKVTTDISGLNDPLQGYPQDGTITLADVHSSVGVAAAVTDTEAMQAQHTLANGLGVFAEPASATTVAALRDLARRKLLTPDDVVVCLLTGHGIKTLPTVGKEPPVVQNAAETVNHLCSEQAEKPPPSVY